MKYLIQIAILVGLIAKCTLATNEVARLQLELKQNSAQLKYVTNLPQEHAECEDVAVPQPECKPEVKYVAVACSPQVVEKEAVKVVEIKEPRVKNLMGFGIGVAKTDTEATISGLNVKLGRKTSPVFSADYTYFINENWGVSGQVQTNETIIMGVKYGF